MLSGPLLRRLAPDRLLIWLVSSRPLELTLWLQPAGEAAQSISCTGKSCRSLAVGQSAFVQLLDITPASRLPVDTLIEYDLTWVEHGTQRSLTEALPYLCHDGRTRPDFVIASHNRRLLHGSCRKPHFDAPDGLVRADSWLQTHHDDAAQRPSWLIMSGDQIYADDVGGPMLVAIHRLIERLGLFGETLGGATVADSEALYRSDKTYYRREELLPDVRSNAVLRERFFGGVKKPVFTTAHAHNHLITFAEVIAMYLLVWSPECWKLVDDTPPPVDTDWQEVYRREQRILKDFVAGLPQVARLVCHLPTLMIFDDHDITDDWNLTAEWERTAYGNPFSRRIIGNALLAYLLCQGWGNAPDAVAEPLKALEDLLAVTASATGARLDAGRQDDCINQALAFHRWSFNIPGDPGLVVLDTRTRRWRSEDHPSRPSGLMDWESLTEMQQRLLDHKSVVIVSPAPMFGVKLIEAIQRLFTLSGNPLLVDAENWMAHRGAAQVMLNIFRHTRTPGNYVILSGDVHYSFVYDIRIRQRVNGPRIWQITSSGLKNSFPRGLLDWFDRLNRWLYSPRSPLNWLTKRRAMHVTPRDPDQASAGERLWNGSGIGLVCLDLEGRPESIVQLDTSGKDVLFPPASNKYDAG
ncbi:alkaline phosphatase family protein [Halopseudomonas nanhaiensis]|nr:alkaline phosphatase family protein [Halopseudomonas nanhaiensis]